MNPSKNGRAELREIADLTASYDEMVTGEGTLRPHWRGLMQTAWSIAPQQLAERQARAATQIAGADELIAFQEPGAGARTRALDLLPLILPESEWRNLAAGLIQRARLLNTIVTDVYGPLRLIAEGLIPPRLVYGNPAFLRPLCAINPIGAAPQLYFYAADLIRLPNGEWRVFSDRVQAAGGVGHALHNRNLLARIFPEAFRAASVQRLQPFIERWRQGLQSLGASLSEQPRIVLLTPGPYNDAYFEHVLLARELGITVVQGADLTVRDDQVFLKTLQGLARVDVIYRRVDGDYSDSLELREESELGIPGLVGALRSGNVAMVNMPGSGVVGTPGLAAFLPELCRRLLGEELRLPAVTTWWCGQSHALTEVRASFDKFAFQPVFDLDPVLIEPSQMSAKDRATFEQRLLADPGNFVARETMAPAHAPCLSIDAEQMKTVLSPQPVVLRIPCVWDRGDWVALPGGIARVVGRQSIYSSALRPGGITKDVWVVSDDNGDIASAVGPAMDATVAISTDDTALRSRTADDLYWLGRYVERLDGGMRQFKAVIRRLASGDLSARDRAELGRLAQALAQTGWIARPLAAVPTDSTMFADGVAEAAWSGVMLRNCIDSIRRLTVTVRDQLSADLWRALRQMTGAAIARFSVKPRDGDVLTEALDDTIDGIAAFAGLVAENMVRGPGWRFLDLGRRIERGLGIAGATRGVMEGPPAQFDAGLHLALELCDAGSLYLLRFRFDTNFSRGLELVMADRANPRSLIFQLESVESQWRAQGEVGGPSSERLSLQPTIAAVSAFPFEISQPERAEETILSLIALLNQVSAALTGLSDEIARTFFSHVAATRLSGIMHRLVSERTW